MLAVELCMCEVVREWVDILTGLSLGNHVFAFFENRSRMSERSSVFQWICIGSVIIVTGNVMHCRLITSLFVVLKR